MSFRKTLSDIGHRIIIIVMFPILLIHMTIKPDDWEEFFDDPFEDEFFK